MADLCPLFCEEKKSPESKAQEPLSDGEVRSPCPIRFFAVSRSRSGCDVGSFFADSVGGSSRSGSSESGVSRDSSGVGAGASQCSEEEKSRIRSPIASRSQSSPDREARYVPSACEYVCPCM